MIFVTMENGMKDLGGGVFVCMFILFRVDSFNTSIDKHTQYLYRVMFISESVCCSKNVIKAKIFSLQNSMIRSFLLHSVWYTLFC